MDGFDDLLAPSRSMLEDNPFNKDSNPFGSRRSGSPDPWASPFDHSHDAWTEDHRTQQSTEVEDYEPETPVSSSNISTEIPTEPVDSAGPGDSLDSTTVNVPSSDEEDNKPLGFKRARNVLLKASGFKESVDIASEDTKEEEGRKDEGSAWKEEQAQDKGKGKEIEEVLEKLNL
ncbi:hypothetical protein C8J55DRAFT_564974 [Lentinula edodes]|uniref:Uncharacterized protein n=1 Tax=Lentinula lateritia TaxID=40482 RepID=A0A9W8ZW87_9AGAR|nr:hypothetical protein C8J55DRAFT_564974 [Lentinula edodes]